MNIRQNKYFSSHKVSQQDSIICVYKNATYNAVMLSIPSGDRILKGTLKFIGSPPFIRDPYPILESINFNLSGFSYAYNDAVITRCSYNNIDNKTVCHFELSSEDMHVTRTR